MSVGTRQSPRRTGVEVEVGLHFVVSRSGRCNIDARVAGGAADQFDVRTE